MRVAYFSDVHGNLRALDAVLEDARREGAETLICGGDIANPYLATLDVWNRLRELGIPVLRGNHEDYVALYHGVMEHPFIPPVLPPVLPPVGTGTGAAPAAPLPDIRGGIQFQPVHHVARHLGQSIARELAALPFALRIPGPGGDDIWAFHASPLANNQSYRYVMTEEMERELARVPGRTLISGHIHLPWSAPWRDKLLIVAGSVGIPMSGRPEPEYALLSHYGGRWHVEHRTVPYDHAGALREFRDSSLALHGGPVAWLLYDEILCAEKRLATLMPRLKSSNRWPATLEAWEKIAREFLTELGRWDEVRKHLSL